MKKFLLLSSLMVFCVFSTVFAGTLVKNVYFSSFPIIINGENYSSETPILNYQNVTYVALREFSEMVEVDVDFKDNTIIINSREEISNEDALKTEHEEEIEVIVEASKENNEEEKIVYVSKTGVKYHLVSNCNGGNYSSIKWSEAKNKGYTSCLRCAANLA